MSLNEVITRLILFHHFHNRDFKHDYIDSVPSRWRREFPRRVSYPRFKELQDSLWDHGVELITQLGRNMKLLILEDFDRILLRQRALIETDHDQLKNISQLEHTRHRSIVGFMVNLVCTLIAYS